MDAQDRPDRSPRGEKIRRELEESRERYRILVETLPHGIQELDLQGVLRFTNPAHDRIFGYPRGAMEGMRVSDLLFREEEREGMEGLFRRMGRDRPEPRPLVFLDRRADGSPLWVEVARRLSRIARQGDTVARLGGDEFVLVLPFLDSPTAMAGVSRRVHGVLRSPLTLRGGRSVEVGCSLGQAVWPRDGRREDDLLRVADNRMYRSKRRRRRVVPEEGG